MAMIDCDDDAFSEAVEYYQQYQQAAAALDRLSLNRDTTASALNQAATRMAAARVQYIRARYATQPIDAFGVARAPGAKRSAPAAPPPPPKTPPKKARVAESSDSSSSSSSDDEGASSSADDDGAVQKSDAAKASQWMAQTAARRAQIEAVAREVFFQKSNARENTYISARSLLSIMNNDAERFPAIPSRSKITGMIRAWKEGRSPAAAPSKDVVPPIVGSPLITGGGAAASTVSDGEISE